MTGSPSSIIMSGLGNGTFDGSPSLLITIGFGIGGAVTIDPDATWVESVRQTTWVESVRQITWTE